MQKLEFRIQVTLLAGGGNVTTFNMLHQGKTFAGACLSLESQMNYLKLFPIGFLNLGATESRLLTTDYKTLKELK